MTLPLTTTTRRIAACNTDPDLAARLLGTSRPSDEPISYDMVLEVLGLDDALSCCCAEPGLASYWRHYAIWTAMQVKHLMADQRSLALLDVAKLYIAGAATDEELAAAKDENSAAYLDLCSAANAAIKAGGTSKHYAPAHAAATIAAAACFNADLIPNVCFSACNAFALDAIVGYDLPNPAAVDAATVMSQRQAQAFRQLVTTGTLPEQEVQP